MGIETYGRVGPQVAGDSTLLIPRLGRDGSSVVQDAHGRYQEAVYRGNVYFAANQAAVTFSAGLTITTLVGLILSNPPGSTKLVVPLQVEYVNTGVIVGVTGISVMPYSASAITHTTALSIKNAKVGQGYSPVALADQGATIPVAPVAWKFLYSVLSTNTGVISSPAIHDLGGSLILAPGTAMAICATAAVTGFASVTWEEVDI